ncbi:MAG: ATP-dependent sacrificial sulfur transferase LarE [Firmicutes bacterium]|nr:ATP-dependent sacrificial sulfur transferase LarE [Bacillota bacterium]
MEAVTLNKLEQLKEILKTLPGAVIAYSGGVDSTFLAVVAHEVLGERVLAVTAVSPTYPEKQLREAEEWARRYGINHAVIKTNEFDEPNFTANPPERCYYCKLALFRELKQIAAAKGDWVLLDGANSDDLSDYRPGHRAAQELGARSPLQEAGFTKQEIREFSKAMSLPTWDKPAYACLASRVPYGAEITPEVLKRIELAEDFLTALGLVQVRVRDHFPLARIEVGKDELGLAWDNREAISRKLHEIGYPYVTLDLDGFRSGSMNEVLTSKQSN